MASFTRLPGGNRAASLFLPRTARSGIAISPSGCRGNDRSAVSGVSSWVRGAGSRNDSSDFFSACSRSFGAATSGFTCGVTSGALRPSADF